MSDKNPVPMVIDPVIAEAFRRPPEDFEYTGYDFPGGSLEPKDPNDPAQVEAALTCAAQMRTPEMQEKLRKTLNKAVDAAVDAAFYGSAVIDHSDDD